MNLFSKPTAMGLISEIFKSLPIIIMVLIAVFIVFLILSRLLKLDDSSPIWNGMVTILEKAVKALPIIILVVFIVIGVNFLRMDIAVENVAIVDESEAGILDNNFFVTFIVDDYVPVYIAGLHKDINRYTYEEFQDLLEERRNKAECVYAYDIVTDRRPRIRYKKINDEILDQLDIEAEYYLTLDSYEEAFKEYINHNEIEL